MAVLFDQRSEILAAAVDPQTHSHDPIITSPRGIVVLLAHGETSADIIDGPVTYGGVAMTRFRTEADTEGEPGRVYGYHVGASIPTNTQTLSIGRTNNTTIMWGVCVSLDAAANTEVVNANGTNGGVLDPAVTLDYAGRLCQAFGIIYSGLGAPSSLAGLTGQSIMFQEDLGNYCARADRQTNPGTTNFTFGFTTNGTTDDVAFLAVAIGEVGGGAVGPFASDNQCGGECGTSGHFDGHGGTPAIYQTTYARNGGRAIEYSPTNDVSHDWWDVGGTKRHAGGHLYLPIYPSGDCELIRFQTASGGLSPELRYRHATHDIVAAVGTGLSTAVPVVPGQWYRVRVLGDVTTNPRTMKLKVDGGTEVTASLATGGTSFVRAHFGASVSTPVTARVVWDDLISGDDPLAYPIADVANFGIVGVQLDADGVHVYNAAGDFKYDNLTDVPLSATDTWTHLIGLLDAIVSWLSAPNATATTEWLRWMFGGAAAMTSVQSVDALSTHRGPDATASGQTLQLLEGASVVDLLTNVDLSGTATKWRRKHMLLSPSGIAWTTAIINALEAKWFRTSGNPGIGGIMLEVAGVLTTPGGGGPGSEQQNPSHTFPGGGTYNVTLTVTDNHGLTHSLTQAVTVP
jgi:hypothetical protein